MRKSDLIVIFFIATTIQLSIACSPPSISGEHRAKRHTLLSLLKKTALEYTRIRLSGNADVKSISSTTTTTKIRTTSTVHVTSIQSTNEVQSLISDNHEDKREDDSKQTTETIAPINGSEIIDALCKTTLKTPSQEQIEQIEKELKPKVDDETNDLE